MSFPTEDVPADANETTPLLFQGHHDEAESGNHAKSIWSRLKEKITSSSYVSRIAPVIFLFSAADTLPTLTIIDIMKRLLCAVWYLRNKPEDIPETGPLPDEKCQTPGPVALFSAFMVVQAILEAVGGFLLASLVAQYGTRVGRKPVLLLILLGQVAAMTSFISVLFIPSDVGGLILLIVWLVASKTFGVPTLVLTCNIMVVDVTPPSDRTAALSVTMGSMAAGMVPCFALGGYIYKALGAQALCFISLGIFALALFYSSTNLVPETFGGSKREEARRERIERRTLARERSLERWIEEEGDSTRGIRRVFRKTYEAVMTVFDPIIRLKPTRKENGRTNYRLLILGIACLFWTLGVGYLGPALISFMTIVLRHDPEKNGFILTEVSIAQFIGLFLLFPLVSKEGRKIYTHYRSRKPHKSAHNQHEESSIEEQRSQDHDMNDPNSEASSAHFDVYLLRWCFFLGFITIICTGFSRTDLQLAIVTGMVVLWTGSHPTLQSVTAASVSPIQAGEAIAGMEMIGHVARVASPIVIGALQSRTILTMPMLMWLAMAACILVSIVFSMFIRDEDRYMPPISTAQGTENTISES